MKTSPAITKNTTLSLKALLLVGVAPLSFGHAAMAQTEGEAVQETARLGTVVVTAQRREETAQDIAVAVSAFSAEQLADIGFQRPNDLAQIAPSVQVSEVYGKFQPIFSIRGITQSDYNSDQTSPIGVYVDESYIGAVFLHGNNYFDIERVEVLRGPQGTLYGKNTTGGAINLISRTPDTDGDFSANVKAGYGNYNAISLDAGIEAPIVKDKLAARVAFTYADDDGYQDNQVAGQPDGGETSFWGVRGTLNFEPTDRFQSILRYTHSVTDQVATSPRNVTDNGFGVPVDFSGYADPADRDFHDSFDNRADDLEVDFDLVTLTNTYSADSFDIVSVSSWHKGDYSQAANTDGSPRELIQVTWASTSEAFSQDLRWVSTGWDNFDLILGAYYGQEELKTRNLLPFYASSLDFFRDLGLTGTAAFFESFGIADQRKDVTRTSYAAYSQARFQVSEKIGIDIGLRYTQDQDDLDYINVSRVAADGTPIGTYLQNNVTADASPDNPVTLADGTVVTAPVNEAIFGGQYLSGPYTLDSATTRSEDNSRVTGKIGVDYSVNDDVLLYASYSRGYRSGNYNGGLYYEDFDNYASPEDVDAYELGLKSEWFDNRLRVNGAVFQYDYTDQQFINIIGVAVNLENAGESQIRGAEIEVLGQPTPELTLRGSATYLDTEYKELTLNAQNPNDPTAEVDLSGNELISAPEFSATASVGYRRPITDVIDGLIYLDASYRTKQWYSAYNDTLTYPGGDINRPGDGTFGNISQDGYALFNGRVSLINEEKGYEFSLWAKNIFDEEYFTYAIDLTNGFGYDYFLAGAPRTFGAELSVEF